MQASHYHGRAKQSVRFDPENVDTHCLFCHHYFTEHPISHTQWKKEQLGAERFEALKVRARTIGKPDLEEVEAQIRRPHER